MAVIREQYAFTKAVCLGHHHHAVVVAIMEFCLYRNHSTAMLIRIATQMPPTIRPTADHGLSCPSAPLSAMTCSSNCTGMMSPHRIRIPVCLMRKGSASSAQRNKWQMYAFSSFGGGCKVTDFKCLSITSTDKTTMTQKHHADTRINILWLEERKKYRLTCCSRLSREHHYIVVIYNIISLLPSGTASISEGI